MSHCTQDWQRDIVIMDGVLNAWVHIYRGFVSKIVFHIGFQAEL